MFKQELAVLKRIVCVLPLTKKSQRKQFIKSLRGRARAYLVNARIGLKRGVLLVLKQEVKIKNNFVQLFRTGALSVSFGLYLFISPHTAVQADFPEKVIPAKTESAVVVIKEQVISEKVPTFQTPIYGYISTRFSARHRGIDIPNPTGAPVKAVTSGKVIFASFMPNGYGNLVIIKHKLGFESLYAHLSEIDVQVDQEVTEQMVIGKVGSTGFSTGPHLHLEIHINGVPVDPLRFVSPTK